LWKAQAEAVAESDESLAPHLESLRDFELIRMPRWQSEGYESEPTLAQIELLIRHQRILSLVAEVESASALAFDSGEDPIAAANAAWEGGIDAKS
jgi:hypothetical protein